MPELCVVIIVLTEVEAAQRMKDFLNGLTFEIDTTSWTSPK